MKKLKETALDKITLLELRGKEYYLRLKGIKEEQGKNKAESYGIYFKSTWLGKRKKNVWRNEQGYRINWRYTSKNNVPRDILVCFVRKKIRNQILPEHFKNRLKIDYKDVICIERNTSQDTMEKYRLGFCNSCT